MSYFGDATGNERSSRASSSRKGKKSNSDKPKQPQRGLGVAQLEKLRLHSQLGFHPSNLHPQNKQGPKSEDSLVESTSQVKLISDLASSAYMGIGDLERSNMAYVQSQPSSDPRWNASNAIFEAEHYAKQERTAHLFQVKVEDSLRLEKWSDSMGSSSHNADSNDSQELDLELRLSL